MRQEVRAEIKPLPSGFFAVFIDGIWVDAASRTIEAAQEILKTFTKYGVDK